MIDRGFIRKSRKVNFGANSAIAAQRAGARLLMKDQEGIYDLADAE